MSFELVKPGAAIAALREGQIGIQRSGAATIRPADLARVGITGERVAVLADAGTQRIALRAPNDDDGEATFPLSVRNGKRRSDSRKVNLTAALRTCGLTADGAAGRYTLIVKDKALLIVNLTELSDRDRKLAKKSATAAAPATAAARVGT